MHTFNMLQYLFEQAGLYFLEQDFIKSGMILVKAIDLTHCSKSAVLYIVSNTLK